MVVMPTSLCPAAAEVVSALVDRCIVRDAELQALDQL